MANKRKRKKVENDPWEQKRGTSGTSKKSHPPRRPKQGTAVWIRLLTMFVIVAVFMFGVAIFFKVRTVNVTGNSLYAPEEIVKASGIEIGDNLMILSKGAAAGKIMAVLPYIEEVRIERTLPDTVTIDVKESDASFAVAADDGTKWLVNASCKVLEQAPASAADYPTLVGITATAPTVGQPLQCEQADGLEVVKVLLEQLENTDYISQIVEIDVTKPYDITLLYSDRFEIQLGGSDEMSYKIQYLTEVLSQLDETKAGVIDLKFEEKKVARFRPW